MPAHRSPDQGLKPFELRTGVGGLPTLGGMFRSGDPATIPPHKFHLLVNMRRTPGGMITRPGLAVEFNTGVEECITGLTEDGSSDDGYGASVLLYPGALEGPGNGTSGRNVATYRAIFPNSSADYSEFVSVLYGPADMNVGNQSPLTAYASQSFGSGDPPTFLSRPFLFRGQHVMFGIVDRSGTDVVALILLHLPGRSSEQARDCIRETQSQADTSHCPAQFTQPVGTPVSSLWPYQWPVGSSNVLFYPDNPFGTGSWRPDASSLTDGRQVIDQILVRNERIDDPLAGTAGVNEVLYFVARQGAAPVKRRLIRWDGVQQTTEFAAMPDDQVLALGDQPYGPMLAAGNDVTTAFAAYRQADGTWTTIGGATWTTGVGADDYSAIPAQIPRGLDWGGKSHILSSGTFTGGGESIHLAPQDTADFAAGRSERSCTPLNTTGVGDPVTAGIDAVVVGPLCYVLGFHATGFRLHVGDFTDPLVSLTGSGAGPNGIRLTPAASQFDTASGETSVWIAAVGDRVFVGGRFEWDPVNQVVAALHHGVYDVTNPQAILNVYRVDDADQTYDEATERYSYGGIAPPTDSSAEGFQAS